MKFHFSKKISITVAIAMIIIIFATYYVVNLNAALADGKSKFLGNIIASSVPANFGSYWNQVTPENSTKWGSVESTRDSMNWGQADTAYNYAKSNGKPFKFHTLVWGSQEPSWVSGLSQADQKAEVLEWMDAAASKYSGSEMIDVVNEPLHAKPSYRNAIGGDGSTGWDWVIWSFQEAKKRFPNSKLLINEYGIISDSNACNNYLTIINLLKSRGLIDGIGIQCHSFNMDTVSTSTMKTILDKLAATGLPIYVSELDMTGDDATQKARYSEKFPVFWEHPSVVGVTLWGYIDGQTWKDGTGIVSSGNTGATESPAMQWLKQYLGSSTTTSSPSSSTPSNGTYNLTNRNSGQLLEVVNADSSDGANVQQWPANNHQCQQWRLQATDSGYYKIFNVNSGKLLEVQYASSDDGANVAQWGETGDYCQQWKFQATDSGYYIVINRRSGKALDVWEWSTANGANVCQWPNTGGANQQWKLSSI